MSSMQWIPSPHTLGGKVVANNCGGNRETALPTRDNTNFCWLKNMIGRWRERSQVENGGQERKSRFFC